MSAYNSEASFGMSPALRNVNQPHSLGYCLRRELGILRLKFRHARNQERILRNEAIIVFLATVRREFGNKANEVGDPAHGEKRTLVARREK